VILRARSLAPGFALALLAGLAFPAQAQVDNTIWEDPDLPDAVSLADLIVLAEAGEVSSRGVVYHVETVLKGPDRGGDAIVVTGLHHPSLSERPPVESGDRAYLLLLGNPGGDVFTTPTPTFGRFPLQDDQVVAPVLDSFVRMRLPDPYFRALISGLMSGRHDRLADDAIETLSGQATATETYLALMVLSEFARRTDLEPVAAVLTQDRFHTASTFKVRMATARALGRVGGPDTIEPLLAMAEDPDEVAAVRSTAITALARSLSGLRGFPEFRDAIERLAALGLDASSRPIHFGGANDPRTNELPSILDAVLRTLSLLRAEIGARPALRALEREDDIDAVIAGLTYFSALGDSDHAGGIAMRMREPDAEDAYLNRLFSSTLEGLTGENLGETRQAWVDWWQAESLEPPDDGDGGR
jgi:HEAT repeats